MLSNSKGVNTCEDKKMRQNAAVLTLYFKKLILNYSRLVLGVIPWCEKEAYSSTGMQKNLLDLTNHGFGWS